MIRIARAPLSGTEPSVRIAVRDPALADAIAAHIARATRELPQAGPALPVVAVRSRKTLLRRAGELAGAIAIVRVTERNARHLIAIVDRARAAGAAGIQLVWDGELPPRAAVERHVFEVLEHARATGKLAPVVLSARLDVEASLATLIAHRGVSR